MTAVLLILLLLTAHGQWLAAFSGWWLVLLLTVGLDLRFLNRHSRPC